MAASATLRLTVRDSTAEIVEDPELRLLAGQAGRGAVELAMAGMASEIPLKRRMRRTEAGELVIRELPAGRYVMLVKSPGHAISVVDIELEAEGGEYSVTLERAPQLTVKVFDDRQEPLPGADVWVQPRGGDRMERPGEIPIHIGTTGKDGTLRTETLKSPKVRITAQHHLHGQIHKEVDPRTEPEALLAFGLAGRIEGLLTEGGLPPEPGRWMIVAERPLPAGHARCCARHSAAHHARS